MVKVGVDTKVLDKKLKKSFKKVNDLSFALREIVRDFFKSNVRHFTLKGSGKFKPLKSKYKQAKFKKFGPRPILVATGKLKKSASGTPNLDSLVKVGKRSAVFGTKVSYSRFLQKGTKKMPARPFMFFTAPQVKKYVGIIDAETKRQMQIGFK